MADSGGSASQTWYLFAALAVLIYRGLMAILLAAFAAEGTSTIHNVGQIERGYERLHERLSALGAVIQRSER